MEPYFSRFLRFEAKRTFLAKHTTAARRNSSLAAAKAVVSHKESVALTMASGRKNLPLHHPCRLVCSSRVLLHCPFLCYGPVYSTGTFLKVMPWMVAQTMVRQLISVVNASI